MAAPNATPAASEPDVDPSRSSLLRDTVWRVGAIGSSVAFGAVSAFVTARWLGPAGQGFASTLGFLSSMAAMVLALGLGDSAVALVAWGRSPLRRAIANVLGWGLLASALGVLPFFLVAALVLGPDESPQTLAIAIVAATLVPSVMATMGAQLLRLLDDLVGSSNVFLVTSAATTAGIVLFVAILDLGLPGAAAAVALGQLSGLALGYSRVLRKTALPLPRCEPGYLREAAPYGIKVEASNLLWLAWGRLDLLLVYTILGAASAGRYSVALTVSAMTGLPAYALNYTSFPRLARADAERRRRLLARLVRLTTATTLVTFLCMAALLPFAIPLVLGDAFAASVVPAIVLCAGAILSSAQWLLARGFAAAGEANLTVVSLALNVLVMCGLDLMLIPAFGLVGAACASVVAPLAGLVPCLRRYARDGSLRELVPSWSESTRLAGRGFRAGIRSAAAAAGRSGS